MRYKVATVEGDLNPGRMSSRTPSGVSAHVLDTFYAHSVVATYRSEDWPERPRWSARYAAVVEAQRRAEQLNAAEALDDDPA
jgi:hypothetical protein